MVKLFVDYQEVALERDTSFSFTNVSPYFSKDSSFSLDISLSLKNSINAKIFGAINRKDVILKKHKYNSSLVIDGKTFFEGFAIIAEVTDEIVNIQLLQGEKETLSDIYDVYIDDVNIGNCYDFDFLLFRYYDRLNGGLWPQKLPVDDFVVDAHLQDTFGLQCLIDTANYSVLDESKSDPYYVEYDYYDVIDLLETGFKYDIEKSDIIYFCPIELNGEKNDNDEPLVANNYSYASGKWSKATQFAPQLRLWYAVQKVFENLGFNVVRNYIKEDSMFSKLIIANANITYRLAKTLPHWTIKDFIKRIEDFCCCSFSFSGKNLTIAPKTNFYSGVTYIKPLKEYSKVIDNNIVFEGEPKNYSYELEVTDYNKYDVIDNSILVQCIFVYCDSIDDRDSKYSKNKGKNVIFVVGDDWYIMKGSKWHLINYFRDYTDNDTLEKVSLALKPAAVSKSSINKTNYLRLCVDGIQFNDGSSFYRNGEFSIIEAVENNENNIEGLDYMPVTFFKGRIGDNSFSLPYVSPGDVLYESNNYVEISQSQESLALTNAGLGYKFNAFVKYNPKIEFHFYFLHNGPLDISNFFFIAGKKYIAKELQREFNVNGPNNIVKGIFYEVIE